MAARFIHATTCTLLAMPCPSMSSGSTTIGNRNGFFALTHFFFMAKGPCTVAPPLSRHGWPVGYPHAVSEPRTHRRRAVFALAALLLGFLLAGVAAELYVRPIQDETLWFAELLDHMTADNVVFRVSDDPELLYELIPGLEVTLEPGQAKLAPEEEAFADRPRRVSINSLGFRDEPRSEAKTGAPRVLCLGGSNTYGAAVSNRHTWPAQLQRELTERMGRPVEVWNLGVDGYNTRQKVRLARIALERWSPDLFVFQTFNLGPRIILQPDLEAPPP